MDAEPRLSAQGVLSGEHGAKVEKYRMSKSSGALSFGSFSLARKENELAPHPRKLGYAMAFVGAK